MSARRAGVLLSGLHAQVASHRAALWAIILLAFILRLSWLDAQSLWADEVHTLDRVTTPPTELLAQLPVEHMPLYFWHLYPWTQLAGVSDFALRFPSVGYGVLSVVLLYALARRLAAPSVARLSALLLAVNPFQVWYAQEARMYTQLAALTLLALWAVDVALSPSRRQSAAWTVYVIAVAVAMYAHLYGILIPIISLLWIAARLLPLRRPLAEWRPVLGAHLALALVCLPWVLRALRIGEYDSPLAPPPLNLATYAGMYTFGTTLPEALLPALGVVTLLLGLVGVWGLSRERDGRTDGAAFSLAVIAIALPIVISTALLALGSVFHPRYFILAAPLYSLVLAQSLVTLARRKAVLGLAAATVLLLGALYSLNLWYVDPHYAKARDKEYIAFILSRAEPDHVLLLNGPRTSLAEHYSADRLDRIVNLRGRLRERGPAAIEDVVGELATEHSVIWLAVGGNEEPGNVKAWLDVHGFQWQHQRVADFTVYAYTFPSDLPPPEPPQSVTGPAPVDLTWTSGHASESLEDVVAVELHWLPTGPLPPDAKVSLRLYTPSGEPVWQLDREPGDGTLDTGSWRSGEVVVDRVALDLPDDLTPGVYKSRVVLYDPQTQTELRTATLGLLDVAH